MTKADFLQRRLERLAKKASRSDSLWDKNIRDMEKMHADVCSEMEALRQQTEREFRQKEESLQGDLAQAGKDYAQKKYALERDVSVSRSDITRIEEEYLNFQKQTERELARIGEERVNFQISIERQKSALQELYEEKKRHLRTVKEKLTQQFVQFEEKIRRSKDEAGTSLDALVKEQNEKLGILRDQAAAKKQGWLLALETIQRERDALSRMKVDVEKKLNSVRSEKEKELEEARIGMQVAREQLEIDKATLIEKAEEDQRRLEREIKDMQDKVASAEVEHQELTAKIDNERKDAEEKYQREESLLKEAVRNETEKRDYEQRLFEQEKADKEKEIAKLRDEYEQKKSQWDNQIRTLLMQKSVQDAEHDAERLRVDREARVVVRSLEAKREELKHRLADLKSRHQSVVGHSEKEKDLLEQRWRWRRDRLWSMWQNRLDVLKKERVAINEQLETLIQKFTKTQSDLKEEGGRTERRIDEIQQSISQTGESSHGQKRQREIQLELEKTRIIAQIKECESHLSDWMDRLKTTQDEVGRRNVGLVEQMNYLDRWYREEEKETELFLHSFQKALSLLQASLAAASPSKDAA